MFIILGEKSNIKKLYMSGHLTVIAINKIVQLSCNYYHFRQFTMTFAIITYIAAWIVICLWMIRVRICYSNYGFVEALIIPRWISSGFNRYKYLTRTRLASFNFALSSIDNYYPPLCNLRLISRSVIDLAHEYKCNLNLQLRIILESYLSFAYVLKFV